MEWVFMEDFPLVPDRLFLSGGEIVKFPPECFRGLKGHAPGGGWFRAIWSSTTRPASKSASAFQKDSGIVCVSRAGTSISKSALTIAVVRRVIVVPTDGCWSIQQVENSARSSMGSSSVATL